MFQLLLTQKRKKMVKIKQLQLLVTKHYKEVRQQQLQPIQNSLHKLNREIHQIYCSLIQID